MDQHRRFNSLLNDLMVSPPEPGPGGARPSRIKYEHLYLVDEFYPTDPSGHIGRGRDRVSFSFRVDLCS